MLMMLPRSGRPYRRSLTCTYAGMSYFDGKWSRAWIARRWRALSDSIASVEQVTVRISMSYTSPGAESSVARRSGSGQERSLVEGDSSSVQEPEVERGKHQDDAEVRCQALPELVSEEQDVHPDHDDDDRQHVKHGSRCLSHGATIRRAGHPPKLCAGSTGRRTGLDTARQGLGLTRWLASVDAEPVR
jgi:hypothetical protein